jgi:hypothetical protein
MVSDQSPGGGASYANKEVDGWSPTNRLAGAPLTLIKKLMDGLRPIAWRSAYYANKEDDDLSNEMEA